MATRPHLGNERVARGDDVVKALEGLRVTICGAGALGANLAEHLARMGFSSLRVVDRDRIEERNLATQPWQKADVGQHKAKVTATMLYRAVGADVDARVVDVDARTVAAIVDATDVVVDCFDNAASRALLVEACASRGLPCLHVGLAPGFGEVVWDERYTVPADGAEDVCDVGLARSLVVLTVVTAAEALVAFAATREKRNHTVTLADLRIGALP